MILIPSLSGLNSKEKYRKYCMNRGFNPRRPMYFKPNASKQLNTNKENNMNLSDFYRPGYEPLKLFNTMQTGDTLSKYTAFLDEQIKERTQYEKINDTYYFDVRGCEKETISCEIADGQLNVIATGKIGEREYDHSYSVRVGEASQYEINCEYKAGVLAVELKKKQSKRTIKIN